MARDEDVFQAGVEVTGALVIGLGLLTVALIVGGIVSCIVPPLPGPVVGYCALVSYELMPGVEGFSVWTYVIWGAVVAAVTVADFIFPAAVTRRFGGTGAAVLGGAVGAFAGLFFAPFGILIGPLVGAVAGDLIGGNRFRAGDEIRGGELRRVRGGDGGQGGGVRRDWRGGAGERVAGDVREQLAIAASPRERRGASLLNPGPS